MNIQQPFTQKYRNDYEYSTIPSLTSIVTSATLTSIATIISHRHERLGQLEHWAHQSAVWISNSPFTHTHRNNYFSSTRASWTTWAVSSPKCRLNIKRSLHSQTSLQLFLIDASVLDNLSIELTKCRLNIKLPRHSQVLKQLFLIDTSSGWDNLSSELTKVPPEY